MGNKASLMLQDEEIRQISEETGFSAQQIEKLYARFTHLDRANCGSLSKNDLLSIPELAINPLCDRLIEMFFAGGPTRGHRRLGVQQEQHQQGPKGDEEEEEEEQQQQQQQQRINFRQFMQVLAAFRTSHLHGNPAPAASRPRSGPGSARVDAHSATPRGTATSGKQGGARHPLDHVEPPGASAGLEDARQAPSAGADVATHSHRVAGRRPGKDATSATSATSAAAASASPGPAPRSQQQPPAPPSSNANNSALVESLSDRLKDKLYFLFKIYDADNDGRISFNDLRSILRMMVGSYIEEVQLDKIATRAFVEVDQDNDGFVEFGEFVRVFAGKDMDDKLRVRFY